jgi:two-component system chemotaxis response regulator CheB
MGRRRPSILVVDDSPVVRQVLTRILSKDSRIGKVDTAPNGELALRKIAKLDPDVVTLDVEMPRMDGIAVLKRIMAETPRPVIMVSAVTRAGASKTVMALELGAVDFVAKPTTGLSRDIAMVSAELLEKVHAVAPLKAKWRRRSEAARNEAPRKLPGERPRACCRDIVAIGASTGGTEAIRNVLAGLPADFPAGVVIVQHMPEGFTRSFADRLNELCLVSVKEAAHRDVVRPGRALLAPGHSHITVHRDELGLHYVELSRGPPVGGHRPSVDVLFDSVADAVGDRAIAVLLTGMGRDGAHGMRRVYERGGLTIAQDAESCVVFGMPKAAISEGSIDFVTPVGRIGRDLTDLVAVDVNSVARMRAKSSTAVDREEKAP